MSEMKTGRRTKEFQDFFTPKSVAKDLFKQYKKYLSKDKVNKILEPTVGSGNLIWVLLKSKYKVDIHCMDIQQDYIDHLANKATSKGYKVIIEKDRIRVIN